MWAAAAAAAVRAMRRMAAVSWLAWWSVSGSSGTGGSGGKRACCGDGVLDGKAGGGAGQGGDELSVVEFSG